MLVQSRTVEADQAVLVGREMGWHPVKQDAQPGAMSSVDEASKPFGISKARRWRIKAGGLITPAGIEGMFADREEFQMGEPHLDHIGDQAVGQSVPGQKLALGIAVP